MPKSDTPRKMNGATLPGRSMPPASPQAATAPPYLVIDSRLASVVEPTESMPPAQRSLASGLPRRRQLVAVDDLGGAEALQIVGLLAAAGRGDHLEAELGQERNRDRADAAGRAGDHHRARDRA